MFLKYPNFTPKEKLICKGLKFNADIIDVDRTLVLITDIDNMVTTVDGVNQ